MDNLAPKIYSRNIKPRIETKDEEDENTRDPFDSREIFDILLLAIH